MSEEIWKPILGWPAYEVSNLGQVRSTKNGKTRFVAPNKQRSGHIRVALIGDSTRNYFVHRLVLENFVGPCPPDKTDGAHLDGNPGNNRLENLQWTTRSENALHRRQHGTMTRGVAHRAASLTVEQVLSMRRARIAGGSVRDIAKDHGCTESNVRMILKGQIWGHIDMCGLPKSEIIRRPQLTATDKFYRKEIKRLKEEIARLHAQLGQTISKSGSKE